MKSPPSARFLTDLSTWNGAIAGGWFLRALFFAQRWARSVMTAQTPCAATFHATWLSSGWSEAGSLFLPVPPHPARKLKVWLHRTAGTAGDGKERLRFVSRRTGRMVREWILNPGGAASPAWFSTTLTFNAPDTLDVYAYSESLATGGLVCGSLSAYWVPEADAAAGADNATIPSGVGPIITQQFFAQDRADSTYALRRIAHTMNHLIAYRSRQVATMNEWGHHDARMGGGYSSATAGFFAVVRVAAGIPSLTANFRIRSAYPTGYSWTARIEMADANTGAAISTTDSAPFLDSTGGFNYATVTVPCAFAASTEVTLRAVFVQSPGGSSLFTPDDVSIWEDQPSATDLGLPSGETIPASFVDLGDGFGRVYGPILAADRQALLQNTLWLLSAKVRNLATFSDAVSGTAGADPDVTVDPDVNTAGWLTFRATPDGWEKNLTAYCGSSSDGLLPGPRRISLSKWEFLWGWKSLEEETTPPGVVFTSEPWFRQPVGWERRDAHRIAAGASLAFRRRLRDSVDGTTGTLVDHGAVIVEEPEESKLTDWP